MGNCEAVDVRKCISSDIWILGFHDFYDGMAFSWGYPLVCCFSVFLFESEGALR